MSGHVQGTGHTLESSRIVSIVSTVIECSSHQIILLRSSAFWNQSEDYDENGNCHFTFLIQEYESTIDEPTPRLQLDRQRRFICVSHLLLIPYSLKHAFLAEVSKNFLRTFSLFFLSVD